ncbi:type I methionyl aminopeptidase [Clostridiaceae bacterium HSG29]|nr:type I methionyl aminopeptidase [Clostridiaceae bacterium HSG29]
MIIIKSELEIEKLRKAGKIVALAHEAIKNNIKAGMSTYEIDQIASQMILKHGAKLGFKGYGGFPGNNCVSVNDEVVHGIPSKHRIVKEGDIVSVDLGSYIDGFYGDAARTHAIGKVSDETQKLIDVTRESFFEGLKFAKVGYRLSDISHAIQEHCEKNGFSIVRDYVGHGVGRNLHEPPQIPNFGRPGRGPRLQKGMVLAIEPMVNMGSFEVRTLADKWTVVTIDGSYSAHYENTIAITDGEPEILTMV